MTTHVIHHNEPNGDLVDVTYLCSESCQDEALRILTGREGATEIIDVNGTVKLASGGSLDFGAWPSSVETDYPVWCANCGAFLWHGLECETHGEPCDGTEDHPDVDIPAGQLR